MLRLFGANTGAYWAVDGRGVAGVTEARLSDIKTGDQITMPVVINSPWWAFWRNSEVMVRTFVVTHKVATGNYSVRSHLYNRYEGITR